MILYADDIALLCSNVDELSKIVSIYNTFSRFGLTISTGKTETMAFNVPDEIKSKPSLILNVRTFKYLGHLITNTDEDPSSYLTFRISSAFQKWFVLTDKIINMFSRIKILGACVRSRLLYSAQSWELTANELNKLETARLSQDNGRKWIQTQKC